MDQTQYVFGQERVLSDKALEIGAVLTLIAIVLNVMVTIIKINAELNFRKRALDASSCDETLTRSILSALHQQGKEPLKWSFLFLSLGISFSMIQWAQHAGFGLTEGICLTIIFFMVALAFLAYFIVLRY